MTTTNQRAVELAPCPWCGSAFVSCCEVVGSAYQVLCEDCVGGGPPESTAPEAIAAWNRRTPGWRPISEAPRDGRPIMVFNPNWSVKVGMAGWDAHENAWRVHGYGCVPSQPTLFQPLPPPPGEAE